MIPLVVVSLIAMLAFLLGHRRASALRVRHGGGVFHSLPGYHGSYVAMWAALPGLAIAMFWIVFAPSVIDQLTLDSLPMESHVEGGGDAQLTLMLNDIKNVAEGLVVGDGANRVVYEAAAHYSSLENRGRLLSSILAGLLSAFALVVALRSVRPEFTARVKVEAMVRGGLMLASTIAILVTVGIVLSLLFETLRFFQMASLTEFLFGLHWSPQTALRADQVGSSGSFGAVPVFTGTLLITSIAMLVAGPIGLLSAIYLNFYASYRFRDVAKPLLEILAGVPTVVYGVFAALVVAPWVRNWGTALGLSVASESALAAGLVMGVMIIPFVSSLSDDAITAVPIALRDGSFGLGATRSETIRFVMVPAALPGIMAGLLLAFSRAIGETMIVVMAAGLAANLTANPLDAVTTVTVQIVALLTGDQEFDSAKTLSAFALGLVLFCVTLLLNVIALRVVKRYRETYE
jgi:phosphate transport system permease protein